jgi:hypothetical protein
MYHAQYVKEPPNEWTGVCSKASEQCQLCVSRFLAWSSPGFLYIHTAPHQTLCDVQAAFGCSFCLRMLRAIRVPSCTLFPTCEARQRTQEWVMSSAALNIVGVLQRMHKEAGHTTFLLYGDDDKGMLNHL